MYTFSETTAIRNGVGVLIQGFANCSGPATDIPGGKDAGRGDCFALSPYLVWLDKDFKASRIL